MTRHVYLYVTSVASKSDAVLQHFVQYFPFKLDTSTCAVGVIDARIDITRRLNCRVLPSVNPAESANCTNFNKFPSRGGVFFRGPYEFVSKEI